MNAPETVYSQDFVKDMSDDEIYRLLFSAWNIDGKIEVWGELRVSFDEKFAGIYDARTINENLIIRYPIQAGRDRDTIVYMPVGSAKRLLDGKPSILLSCELKLATPEQRAKRGNPFLLEAIPVTARKLVAAPFLHSDAPRILSVGVSNYISEAIYDHHSSVAHTRLAEELTGKQQELADAEIRRLGLAGTADKLRLDISGLRSQNDVLKSEIESQLSELILINQQCQKAEHDMSLKIERLRSYIAEKAVFLKDFEFIDEEDFDAFVRVPTARSTSDMLSFADVLKGDYGRAVSYIQAFLKERNVLYPRHTIENYLTLIRSNDLIILAGDSGSGKTNLVQSFAEAVGGVSKIIPVKPNWTSSEDLLGYYNPLERRYLATPFLDALIEARQHPDVPYFICLDEMNLARVEFYFADFLSKLETRDAIPEIPLYSDDESGHVLSELKAVFSVISEAKAKYAQGGSVDFVRLMQDEQVNAQMKSAFGFGDKDSLIKYHGEIRRMLSGVMNTESSITLPANVRIIGAINIDETTHYLSPKVLDRAHIMKFKSPLLADWDAIFSEIDSYDFDDVSRPLHFEPGALGVRTVYPKFERDDQFCALFMDLNREFFHPLGVEFGMRTIRQGLHYLNLFAEVNDDQERAVNNFIVHKVLPKFTFDGNKQTGSQNKMALIEKVLLSRLEQILPGHASIPGEFSCVVELRAMINNAKSNDGVVNYWA